MLLLRRCRPHYLQYPVAPSKKGLYNTSSLVRIYYQLFSPVYCLRQLLLYFEEKKQYSRASIVQKVDRSNNNVLVETIA
jgi:hypothetical protein